MATETTPSALTAASIITRNTTIDFDALPRESQLRRIESHYQCYTSTAVALLDHPSFDQIVVGAELERGWAGLSKGTSAHRGILALETARF